jgi:hypothetical protein
VDEDGSAERGSGRNADRPKKSGEDNSTEEFLRKIMSPPSVEMGDEDLMEAILREARRDFFCGVGRVFLDDFAGWYGCDRERIIDVLRRSGRKWRLDPNGVAVLINL